MTSRQKIVIIKGGIFAFLTLFYPPPFLVPESGERLEVHFRCFSLTINFFRSYLVGGGEV